MSSWTLEEALTKGQGTERPFRCPSHDDKFASASVNVIKGVWYCPSPETRLLTADLRWVAIRDLNVGDQLVGFDEEVQEQGKRQWRKARILQKQEILQPCYDIKFSDGTTIRASAGHQWLSAAPSGNRREWRTTQELQSRKGGHFKIMRASHVWEEDTSREAGYLSAAFDGEGCLMIRPRGAGRAGTEVRLLFYQKPNPMLAEVERCLKLKGYNYGRYERADGVVHLIIHNKQDAMRFLGEIRPPRLLQKFDASLLGGFSRMGWAEVDEVIDVGVAPVIAMQTSTATYLAEGLASHNCYACHDSGGLDKKHVPSSEALLSMLEPEKAPRLYPESYLELFQTQAYWQSRFPDWLCFYANLGHDPFSGNDTFPVRTPQGFLAGVGMRITDAGVAAAKAADENPSRYKYPYGWSASTVLGGRTLIPNIGHVVLVEGYADAVSLWEVGIPALCTYGAGLHFPQLEFLYRLPIKHLVLGFDMDEAGQLATARSRKALKEVIPQVSRVDWPESDPAECTPAQRYEAVFTVVGGTEYVAEQWSRWVAQMQATYHESLELTEMTYG